MCVCVFVYVCVQLIEDLRKQLEHLQLYKLEAEGRRGRLPSAGLQEYHTRTREAELEHEVKRLKQVNARTHTHTHLHAYKYTHLHAYRHM